MCVGGLFHGARIDCGLQKFWYVISSFESRLDAGRLPVNNVCDDGGVIVGDKDIASVQVCMEEGRRSCLQSTWIADKALDDFVASLQEVNVLVDGIMIRWFSVKRMLVGRKSGGAKVNKAIAVRGEIGP